MIPEIFVPYSKIETDYCKKNLTDQRCPGTKENYGCKKIKDLNCHSKLSEQDSEDRCNSSVLDQRCPGTSWYCTVSVNTTNELYNKACDGVLKLDGEKYCYNLKNGACQKPISSTREDKAFCKENPNDLRCYSLKNGFMSVFPNLAFCTWLRDFGNHWPIECSFKQEGKLGQGCFEDNHKDCSSVLSIKETK